MAYSFSLRAPSGKTLFVAAIDAPQAALGAETLHWLDKALASAPAQAAGVRLVMGHLPLAGVSTGKNKPGEVLRLADAQGGSPPHEKGARAGLCQRAPRGGISRPLERGKPAGYGRHRRAGLLGAAAAP